MPRTRSSRGSCTTPPAARTRRTTCPPSGATGTGASSTRAGTRCARRRFARQKAARRRPAGRRAHAAARPRSRPGTRCPTTSRSSTPARWRSTPASRRMPTPTSGGCWTPIDEMGELDNTLVIYIFGDNGASLEGTVTGSFNEMTMANGIPLTPEQQLSLIGQYGGLDAWGTDAYAPHYAARMGVGRQHAVPVGQAGRLAPRRDPRRHGRVLAGAHQGPRRSPVPVHPLHRHRPDDPRGRRHPAGEDRRRHRAGADARDELRLHLRRRGRRRAAHGPVLGDLRQPGHLQGRLVGLRQARPHPVGRHTGDHRAVRARQVRPRAGHLGALLPARRLHPGPRTSRPSSRRSSPSSRSCSGRRPSGTTCCRCSAACASSSGSCRRCRRSPGRRSTATSRTSRRA